MKKINDKISTGNKTLVNGMVALFIVALIALGCTCGKDFDLSNIGKESDNRTVSNTTNSDTKNEDTKTKVPIKKADASKSEIPSDDEMQEIVKATLLDFNDAIQKEDFTNFHSNISKVWQRQVKPDELKGKFQIFIDGDADLSGIRSLKPTFTSPAKIDKSKGTKTLEVKGEYPTSPNNSTFELSYVPEGKEWKLFGLNVVTTIKRR